MTHLASAMIDPRTSSLDELLLKNLYLAIRTEAMNAGSAFMGLIHQPALALVEESVDPVSVAVLVDQPAPYCDSYEFEPPLEMTGSAVLRLERVELPDIEWDY